MVKEAVEKKKEDAAEEGESKKNSGFGISKAADGESKMPAGDFVPPELQNQMAQKTEKSAAAK